MCGSAAHRSRSIFTHLSSFTAHDLSVRASMGNRDMDAPKLGGGARASSLSCSTTSSFSVPTPAAAPPL
eukprot:CAMPEP_0113571718 /NCGR_PEP_ID=MMETSP0015_2-20120614/25707_1 /TAXON_ID=2838 /ORGANISM="Odontella" /LENGTH=68 /DNA_ID=CAMNT_0000474695 /DNA_START=634 /DNA_END=837 /DNA_ORIENTATION=- /assembly_acc=CAM_ASM_000160